MTPRRIICVDDDPRVLEGLDNHLSMEWEVTTCTSGLAALDALAASDTAVIISDMRMPVMTGAQLLAQVRRRFPDTVRILLTGQSDLRDAATAVNDGEIFRLLLKPCPTEQLIDTVVAAFRQHDLLVAERVVLQQTLRGAVEVLTEVLGLVQPLAFGRANRVAALVRHMVAGTDVADAWQIELAAMLSQLGCVTFDGQTLEDAEAGRLAGPQAAAFARHPELAASLLARIPRLEEVATMVAAQQRDEPVGVLAATRLGSEALQLAVRIDRERRRGTRFAAVVDAVAGRRAWSPALLTALRSFDVSQEKRVLALPARDLRVGMVLEADALSVRDELLMARGQQLTDVALKRLRALAERGLLREPVLAEVAEGAA